MGFTHMFIFFGPVSGRIKKDRDFFLTPYPKAGEEEELFYFSLKKLKEG